MTYKQTDKLKETRGDRDIQIGKKRVMQAEGERERITKSDEEKID